MNKWLRRILAGAIFLAVLAVPAGADVIPMLWGVDEDDGQLFSIGDYTNPLSTFIDYGRLKWNRNGSIRNIGHDLEAFALDIDGIAYMSLNKNLGSYHKPVLMSIDLNQVSPTEDNIVNIIGEIGLDSPWKGIITGLDINPVTGDLYGLLKRGGGGQEDRLLILDKTTGQVQQDLGALIGLGETVGSGEDLVFDEFANLYVTDDKDDHLYQVDPQDASIIAILDDYARGGLPGSVKFEGLAWDYENDRLIGTDDRGSYLAELTFQDGSNYLYADLDAIHLTDVEGISFGAIPEPTSLLMLACGGLLLVRRRRRA